MFFCGLQLPELFQEVDQILVSYDEADEEEGAFITATAANVEHLLFTKCCIYEALRLYPTVPSFPRLSVNDTKLGGYDLPSGNVLNILWTKPVFVYF